MKIREEQRKDETERQGSLSFQVIKQEDIFTLQERGFYLTRGLTALLYSLSLLPLPTPGIGIGELHSPVK